VPVRADRTPDPAEQEPATEVSSRTTAGIGVNAMGSKDDSDIAVLAVSGVAHKIAICNDGR
jgi:hypothetical protein